MGRLFLSCLKLAVLLFFIVSNSATAQKEYFIVEVLGKPLLNKEILKRRGTAFGAMDSLQIQERDTVFLANELGELFELYEPNIYVYKSIESHKKQSNNSLSRDYFNFIWKEFSNQKKVRQRPGVVYREERNITLKQPVDSARKYGPEILFSWKNKTGNDSVYFHLQELDSKHITKVGTTSTSLKLFRDYVILKPGVHYKWAVTSLAFPDLGKIKFNSFHLLSTEEHLKLKAKMEALTKALRLLGFSENYVKFAVCMDYKFCNP